VQLIRIWLEDMLSRHFIFPQDWDSQLPNLNDKVSLLKSIINSSLEELVKHVTVQCQERGTLLLSLIEISFFLYDKQLEDL